MSLDVGQNACWFLSLVKRVHMVHTTQGSNKIFQGIECIKDFVYDADIWEEAKKSLENKPPGKIPYRLMEEVRRELTSMEQKQIFKEITESTPSRSKIVIVKQLGKIRICLDPIGLNKVLVRCNFQLKTLEEMVAYMRRAKRFTLLGPKKGFWQTNVSERMEKYLAFTAPWGGYCLKRIPFGIAEAPCVFQQAVRRVLEGIPNTMSSMDNILVYAETSEMLQEYTRKVMEA